MISHKHKCIFIHISKCAGSSIETAFGIDVSDNTENNNINLFGWNEAHKLFLQHATPEELVNYGFISQSIWKEYYKFIIVRNPFSRAKSDYLWLVKDSGIKDSFENFLEAKGKFESILKVKNHETYRGDHLTPQLDYFYLNGDKISYDRVLRFESLNEDLKLLCEDLKLNKNMFAHKVNVGKAKRHYSYFYNKSTKALITQKYKRDLKLLNYDFEDKRNVIHKLLNSL
ncbi:sulfotransferase family 2 domain-containing protein [Xanthomarina gelatinilytica]|uniref:sulfotransferase family 2 domain-containing protein n=1 Tax=Xanthomarina gelatinilytica TaxID=1137281 RepID=UPI003AA7F82D